MIDTSGHDGEFVDRSTSDMSISFLEPLPRLYFAHTPKTGGLALGTVLRDAYGWGARLPAMARRELVGFTVNDLQRYHLYSGHWGIGFLALVPADTRTMTILRDPIEQIVSWWHHMRRTIIQYPAWYAQDRHLWRPIMEQDLSGTLQSTQLVRLMANMQCKHLGLHFDLQPFVGAGADKAAVVQAEFQRAFIAADDGAAYTHARQTIRTASVLGITEQFDGTLKTLCRFLGIPRPRRQPQTNLNPVKSLPIAYYYRSRLDERTLRRLEEMTCYDHKLYAEGLELFAVQQQSLGSHYIARYRAIPALRCVTYRSVRQIWQHTAHRAPWLKALRR
jgi:hypothetical protein